MKILLISPEDTKGNTWGGVSTYTTLLANYLGRIHQEVYVLMPGSKNKLHELHPQSVHVKGKSDKFFVWNLADKACWKFFPLTMKRVHWGLDVLRYVQTQGPFDVIEAPEWGNSTLFVSLCTKEKVVVTLHRGWYCYKKDNDLPMNIDVWLVCFLEFLSIIVATAISSPTRYMLSFYKFFIGMYKLRGGKIIHYIPYGVEIGAVRKSESAPGPLPRYILFVGRVEKAKGPLVLIQAFQRIACHYRNIDLVLVGENMGMWIDRRYVKYKTYLQSYVRRCHLKNRVHFAGKKTRDQLIPYYDQCLFLVVPSEKRENSPYVVFEAISRNKTAIVSTGGGLPEMIKDEVNGLLFTRNNVEMLAEKMSYLIDHEDVRRRFERYNAIHKKEFDIKKIAVQTLSFYKSI